MSKQFSLHCSNGFREFDSHTTTNIYEIMNTIIVIITIPIIIAYFISWWENAEERKATNDLMNKAILECKEIEVIVVDINGGFYKITTDVVGYYSSSSHYVCKNVLENVLNRIKVNDGVNDLSKYELIIK